ncbi:MAG: PAS domain S-box protein [Cytophagales bacterium]|nr:MAG: PAS domain S-box protein [Cytophagales bacterium]
MESTSHLLQTICNATIEVALVTVDLQGYVTFFGKGAERMLGYQAKEVEKQVKAWHFYIPEQVEAFAKELSEQYQISISFTEAMVYPLRLLESYTHEWTLKRKDGSTLQANVAISALYQNQNLIGFLAIGVDITEQKDTEKELNRIKHFNEAIRSSTPDILYLYDNTKSQYLFLNQQITELTGYELAYWEKTGQNSLKNTPKKLKQMRQKNSERIEFEFSLKHKNGKTVWLESREVVFNKDENNLPLQWLGVAKNITEKRQAQKKLKENEEIYRLALKASNDAVWVYDTKKDTLSYPEGWNTILGYDEKELPQQFEKLQEIIHPDDWENYRNTLQEVRINQKQDLKFTTRFKHKHQHWMYFLVRAIIQRNNKGEVVRVIGANTDITEIKNKELILEKARVKAEKASQTKSQFLSMMTHEIRTPLNAVIGITHLLLEENPAPAQIENLNTLKFSAENLLVIINDILDFSKIEQGKIEFEELDFDLYSLMQNIKQTHETQAQAKNIQIKLMLDSDIPNVLVGDTVRLSQILNNLIGNAIKFTTEGIVKIEVTRIANLDEEVVLHFNIADTGIGIPEDKINTIFESFTQAYSDTTRRFGGTGLGLAITKRLLELQNSTIGVKSKPDQGSSFYFNLSFKKSNLQTIQPTNNTSYLKLPRIQNIKVLLVEDNEINRLLTKKFLDKWGVEVDFAYDGFNALEKIQSQQYTIVLMDLQMPDMDGYQTTQLIREMHEPYFKKVPIIAITASAMNEVAEKAHQAGMNDYIAKPFNPQDLYVKILKHTQQDILPQKIINNIEKDAQAQFNDTLQPYNLSEIEEMTAFNATFRTELSTLCIKNLQELSQNFEKNLLNKDHKAFHFSVHKAKAAIKMLEANQIQQLIEEASQTLNDPTPKTEEYETSIKKLNHSMKNKVEEIVKAIQEKFLSLTTY